MLWESGGQPWPTLLQFCNSRASSEVRSATSFSHGYWKPGCYTCANRANQRMVEFNWFSYGAAPRTLVRLAQSSVQLGAIFGLNPLEKKPFGALLRALDKSFAEPCSGNYLAFSSSHRRKTFLRFITPTRATSASLPISPRRMHAVCPRRRGTRADGVLYTCNST